MWVEDWFTLHATKDGGCIVKTFARPDKYGRWLGLVYALDSPVSLNAELLSAGIAWPYHGGPRG
jgi:hypothetical protein